MLFLVLLLAIFHPFNITSAATGFDAFYLILRWPPAFCKFHSCNTPYIEDRFTLHGLWPVTLGGKSPDYSKCKKIPFNANQLIHSEIIHDLNNLWPSLEKNRANIKFWEHEWERHDKCTMWEQFRYFQTSIERVKHVNTLRNVESIRPIIECRTKTSDAHPVLYQVYFCLTQDGEQFQNCPPPKGQLGYGCGTALEVIFPSTEGILPSSAMAFESSWNLYLITYVIFNVIIYLL
ncbi:intracellular ribonuclease LX-like isoform X1 [Manihot esculenta]|uniref:intracellular ribonuclease LX-like isoform X1 n=1 Tax=Manihot esculenta TaxID=3983 RepID=UPI001CC79D9A|nr:intracellular ribonuclease LX-like isoform X1 [Manihot esculenta]